MGVINQEKCSPLVIEENRSATAAKRGHTFIFLSPEAKIALRMPVASNNSGTVGGQKLLVLLYSDFFAVSNFIGNFAKITE